MANADRVWCLAWSALALLGCTEERELAEPPLVFADVEPILEEHCVECHSGPSAEADYRLEDYFETIRCIPDPDGQPATLPSDDTAPILAVLERPDHADLLDADETKGLTNWVTDGAIPANRSTHPGQWNDPARTSGTATTSARPTGSRSSIQLEGCVWALSSGVACARRRDHQLPSGRYGLHGVPHLAWGRDGVRHLSWRWRASVSTARPVLLPRTSRRLRPSVTRRAVSQQLERAWLRDLPLRRSTSRCSTGTTATAWST